MDFPVLSEGQRIERLQPPKGKVRMVLDTDTYNEIDDQFAVVQALLSPKKLNVEALYAAPFSNSRSAGPGDGMEKSYQEILRLLRRLGRPHKGFVFKGSKGYLAAADQPRPSAAARDLVRRARSAKKTPLYVVAIGAITNVASAVLMDPKIIKNIVVVWLGGHAHYWPRVHEFNLKQDVHASRLMFDCGVPLIHMPCMGVTTHLATTVPEIERYVRGRGAIGDYLADIFAEYGRDKYAWSKVLWDMVTIAYLLDPGWVPTTLVHSPILTDQLTWSHDSGRHLIRCATYVKRDPIFADFFRKLEAFAKKR
ncbi:MAG: nucleoside hydrolase [Kiritimatiellae bacterium]|nr:nucleoside hydrolase [Kiritimatiellia bacterium]